MLSPAIDHVLITLLSPIDVDLFPRVVISVEALFLIGYALHTAIGNPESRIIFKVAVDDSHVTNTDALVLILF